MRFGISTFFYIQKPLSDIIEEAISYGIKAIEIVYEHPHIKEMDNELVRAIRDYNKDGVQFAMHAPFIEMNLGSMIREIRDISKDRMETALEMAAEMTIDSLIVHPGYTFLNRREGIKAKAFEYFIENLVKIVELGKTYGIRVCLENLYIPFCFFSNLKEFEGLHEVVPELGIAFDIGHGYIEKRLKHEHDPEGAILKDMDEAGIKHIFHIHLHNNIGIRDEHQFLKGDIDMERILKGLSDRGYEGSVIIETYDAEQYGIGAILERIKAITL